MLLVDDHRVVLGGMRALPSQTPDLEVVAVATDGAGALTALADAAPDVAVVDLRLPDMDGTELSRRLLLARPELRIVVLTMHADDELVLAALAAGASAYMLKDAPPEDVVDPIRQAARGHLVIGAGARGAVVGAPDQAHGNERMEQLSARERAVLELLARGLTTTGIAARLGLAPKTVRNRLSEVYANLGVADRAAAVALARDAGVGRAGSGRVQRPRLPGPG